MSRGINEQDVWKAADALLIEGARPTIERVRLKIGRGSPNTVSPHLETWFARLGARIADPQAFRAPEPQAPEPVRELAQQLWGTAQAIAHQAVESRALEAEARATAALAGRDALAAKLDRLLAHTQAQIQTQAAELDALRLALAGAQAQLAERETAHARELAGVQLEREQLREQARAAVDDADARAHAAERRAAADMDRERQARLRSEQRQVDQQRDAAAQLERERARSRSEQLALIERHARLEARLAQLQAQIDRGEAERLRQKIQERRAQTAEAARPRRATAARPVAVLMTGSVRRSAP